MYLKGLNGIGSLRDAGVDEVGWNPADPLPAPSSTPPTDNVNWTGVVSSAITAWGNLETAKLNSKTAIATAPYSSPYYRPGYTLTPTGQLMPVQGSAFAFPMGTLILIAAALAAVYLISKE